MAEVALCTFSQVVLSNLDSIMADKNKLPSKLQNELEELRDSLLAIISALVDAEEKQTTSALVKDWLIRVQDVVYDLDDVLDEISIELALRQKNNRGHLLKQVFSPFSYLNPLSQYSLLTRKIGGARLALDSVARGLSSFSFMRSVGFTRESRETSSFYLGNQIIGRYEDKEQIVSWICGPIAEVEELSYVTIVGVGGLGKTTLAKLVFNDGRIQNNFDIKLWVEISQRFSVKSVLQQMIASATGESLKRTDVGELRKMLYEVLRERKYFLVLDDCWTAEAIHLREVIDCGCRGSTVVVTTRVQEIARAFGTPYVHLLPPLPEDVSFQLFMQCAFSSTDMPNHPNIERLAREIVKHCRGVPLFLIILGGILRGEIEVREWEWVLDKLRSMDDDPLGVSQLVYAKLPSYLKLPFCSFPLQKYCGTNADELVCLWMALGFLHSDGRTQQPEYIGRNYLSEFAKFSLIHDVEYSIGGVVSEFNVHDMVYDLAMPKARDQCAIVSGNNYEEIPKGARWVILDEADLRGREFSTKLLKARKTRALMILTQETVLAEFMRVIVSEFKCLRVLGLGGCDIETLPDSIGHLKHLRYLDLRRNPRMKKLPDSICNLLLLQTLFIHGCDQLEEVPVNIGRLESLRYLTLTTRQEYLPDEIGNLSSLRTMGLDSCPKLAYLPSSIKNLKNLQTLGLVDCPELDLLASSSVEGLKAIDNIETMLLVGLPKFMGLPSDLGIPAISLKNLQIQNCSQLTETKWIKQFSYLHSLAVENCAGLLAIGDGSSPLENLEELVIKNCHSLNNATWITQFISLYSLVIGDCPNLSAVGEGFSELKNLEWLEIKGCPHLTRRCARDAGEDWPYIKHVQKIQLDGTSLH